MRSFEELEEKIKGLSQVIRHLDKRVAALEARNTYLKQSPSPYDLNARKRY